MFVSFYGVCLVQDGAAPGVLSTVGQRERAGRISLHSEPRQRSVFVAVSRAVAAGALTLALLSAGISSTASALRGLCRMECCAGLAPHAAGSCAGASCHADFSRAGEKAAKDHGRLQASASDPSDPVCDVRRAKPDAHARHDSQRSAGHDHPAKKTRGRSDKGRRPAPALAARSLAEPCLPGCGAASSGFSRPRRQLDPATLAGGHKARPSDAPATLSRLSVSQLYATRKPQSFRPRGPPPLS